SQVQRFEIDAEHVRAAARKLDTVEAGIAADVEHGPAGQILRDRMRELFPFEAGKIAVLVSRRRLHAPGQMQIVEPRPERFDLAPDGIARARRHLGSSRVSSSARNLACFVRRPRAAMRTVQVGDQLVRTAFATVRREHARPRGPRDTLRLIRSDFAQQTHDVLGGARDHELLVRLEHVFDAGPSIGDDRRAAGSSLEQADARILPRRTHIRPRDVQGPSLTTVELGVRVRRKWVLAAHVFGLFQRARVLRPDDHGAALREASRWLVEKHFDAGLSTRAIRTHVAEIDVLATIAWTIRVDVDAADRKSTRLNSSHVKISYAVFCLKKKKNTIE